MCVPPLFPASRGFMAVPILLLSLLTACGGGGGGGSDSATGPTPSFSFVSASGSSALLRSGHAIAFTDTSTGGPTSWLWDFGDNTTSTEQNPVHIFTVPATDPVDATKSFTVTLTVTSEDSSSTTSQNLIVHEPEFNLLQGISEQAQSTTMSFSGFAMMTGNLHSQTFFPPGKVADYTGFQYLRDNDPSGMGHNTSFLTKVADNVIYLLTDAQLAQLASLATNQQDQFQEYGYKRYTLMKAFRLLMDGQQPSGTSLNLDAIKACSRALYHIDGQISFGRAVLYADIINQMKTTANPNDPTQLQLAYLDAMKGKGWSGWPDVSQTGDTAAQARYAAVQAKMKSLPKGSAVLVMTYAGDIYSWYNGSVDADVYFCPERHGTYYGGFYMKDAPAIGHEGYSIDTKLTAAAGNVLLTPNQTPYNMTTSQAAAMASLWGDTEKSNLTSIVSVRTQIAMLLRTLLESGTDATTVETQVLNLSEAYGALDGENNHHLATGFAQIYSTLSSAQATALAGLRKQILSGDYSDGSGSYDFTTCTNYYLYSDLITDTSLLDPYVTAATGLFK